MGRTTWASAPTRRVVTLALCLPLVSGTGADHSSGYYDDAMGKTGEELRLALHEIIDDHLRFEYTGSGTDTWDIVAECDEDPASSSRVRTLYKNKSTTKSDHSRKSGWNREHSWPKSYGFSQNDPCNYPYTDCHQLFAADWNYNIARSNRPYDWVYSGGTEYPVDDFSGSSNWGNGSGANSGEWEVWTGHRGDAARAILYMDVRYEGGKHGATDCDEPDLIVTNDRDLIHVDGDNNFSPAYMGLLSVLLEWHLQDPVDAREENRNEVIYGYQGNRNPFIDHPEWVEEIWGSPPPPNNSDVWINELHYDNTGTDTGEFVEVAGEAGTDLTSWTIVLYNGNGGAAYGNITLGGVLPDQDDGFGTAWFSHAGIQNGSPDGLALVEPGGDVVQFLSYEGSFTATDGVAAGLNSEDINVSEIGSTPVGYSLRLVGAGSTYDDFGWAVPAPESPGSVNQNQDFHGDSTPPGIPSGLRVIPTEWELLLDWDDNPESDLNGYHVYRSTVSGGSYTQLTTIPHDPSDYLDSSVTPGATYYYVVSAVDFAGNESAASEERSGKTIPVLHHDAWINELHYDDVGADAKEGVEIAGTAGLDLLGWMLVLYNGNNGTVDDLVPLHGVLPDQQSGYGTLWFHYTGLQNGAPDGLALLNEQAELVQFLSYEGSFVATDGPLLGLVSEDIGVAEDSATPNRFSLQLGGSGESYADFAWQPAQRQTRGVVNRGQVLGR